MPKLTKSEIYRNAAKHALDKHALAVYNKYVILYETINSYADFFTYSKEQIKKLYIPKGLYIDTNILCWSIIFKKCKNPCPLEDVILICLYKLEFLSLKIYNEYQLDEDDEKDLLIFNYAAHILDLTDILEQYHLLVQTQNYKETKLYKFYKKEFKKILETKDLLNYYGVKTPQSDYWIENADERLKKIGLLDHCLENIND